MNKDRTEAHLSLASTFMIYYEPLNAPHRFDIELVQICVWVEFYDPVQARLDTSQTEREVERIEDMIFAQVAKAARDDDGSFRVLGKLNRYHFTPA